MESISVVLLDSDEESLEVCRDYFEREDKFEFLGASSDGVVGWEMIRSLSPDVVVLSLLLKGLDANAILDRIREENIATSSIVLCGFADEVLANRVLSKGATFFLVKPVPVEVLAEKVVECFREKTDNILAASGKKKAIEEEISSIFISIGIPPHIKGYHYLREGIKMTVAKPSIINNVTKELYPKIGEKFSTSASKVERAIRHAIEVAWNRGRIDAINSVFGARVYIGTEKPTNSEFIALVADKLILQNMI